jgi:hypothetical protein
VVVNGCNPFVVVQCRQGLESAVQKPKDLSSLRRQAQKLDVFSWQKLEH